MVRGYHIIMTAYGFWLPNDPRGSWSTEVYAEHLRPFGEATKTDARQSVASRTHDRSMRLVAKTALKHDPVVFNGLQARSIARGIANIVKRMGIQIVACAIMPDHTHLVTLKHALIAEQAAAYCKRAASRQLKQEQLWTHSYSPWAKKSWCVYLNSGQHIRGCIRYVENNPTNVGLKPQHWKFVQPYPV